MTSTTTAPTAPRIDRVAGHIAAEIHGIDLAAQLDPSQIDTIRTALLTHKVLFLRGQRLDHAAHVALAQRFGQLTRRPGDKHGPAPNGFPQILTIDPDAEDERYGRDFEERYRGKWTSYQAGWHTDLTPAVNPPAISILRAEVVPAYGGDTQWTNLVAAYQGLAPQLQQFADTLRAEHTFFAGCHMLESDPEDVAILAMHHADPLISVHPVVRVHPETGEKALFVHPASVTRIIDMTPAESRHVLGLLFAEITRPEYRVQWRWQAGDVAMWDNRATAHLAATDLGRLGHHPGHATSDHGNADHIESDHTAMRRTMYRVTVLGDRPTGPDGFVSQAIAGPPLLAIPE